jgi:hypothetical protein
MADLNRNYYSRCSKVYPVRSAASLRSRSMSCPSPRSARQARPEARRPCRCCSCRYGGICRLIRAVCRRRRARVWRRQRTRLAGSIRSTSAGWRRLCCWSWNRDHDHTVDHDGGLVGSPKWEQRRGPWAYHANWHRWERSGLIARRIRTLLARQCLGTSGDTGPSAVHTNAREENAHLAAHVIGSAPTRTSVDRICPRRRSTSMGISGGLTVECKVWRGDCGRRCSRWTRQCLHWWDIHSWWRRSDLVHEPQDRHYAVLGM